MNIDYRIWLFFILVIYLIIGTCFYLQNMVGKNMRYFILVKCNNRISRFIAFILFPCVIPAVLLFGSYHILLLTISVIIGFPAILFLLLIELISETKLFSKFIKNIKRVRDLRIIKWIFDPFDEIK